MKLRDFRKQLREWPPLRTMEGDPSIHAERKRPISAKANMADIATYSDGSPILFEGSFREGEHKLTGVDPGSGESVTCLAVYDASGRVLRVSRLEPTEAEKLPKFAPRRSEPRPARLIATSLDERAGANGVFGGDCSATQVCPRTTPKDVFKIHRDCAVTSLGRSFGTLFSRYYRDEATPSPVLKATFWETYDWAVQMMDPHSVARLVRLIKNPIPPEYETIKDVRALHLCCSPVEGREERLGVFNLYPAEVDACACQSPWDGARADCNRCRGLGWVWRHRLHPSPFEASASSYTRVEPK